MIKNWLFILLLLICEDILAQAEKRIINNSTNSQVEIYYKSLCDGKIMKVENFTLVKNGIYYYSSNGICNVFLKGFYSVMSKYENIDFDSIYVQSGHNIDTIPIYQIHIGRSPGIPPRSYYECCDKPCDGEIVENWGNGIVKINGKFRDGKIIEMSTYDTTGIIKKKIQRSNHASISEHYDKGKLLFKIREGKFFTYYKVWDQNKNRFHRKLTINAHE